LAIRLAERFFVYHILHVDDTPHRIALGVATGLFVAWTPTIGAQMALTVLLCAIFRANKLVGVPFVWISNPLTIIPVYYPSYLVGAALMPGTSTKQLLHWRTMVSQVFDSDLSWWDRILGFWRFALEIAGPLWLGSILVGLAIAGLAYWVTYSGVVRYRRRFGHPRRARRSSSATLATHDNPTMQPDAAESADAAEGRE